MEDDLNMGMEHCQNESDISEDSSTHRKTYPNVTLSTTNPIWTGLGLNLGLHGETPVTNHLNHGTTIV